METNSKKEGDSVPLVIGHDQPENAGGTEDMSRPKKAKTPRTRGQIIRLGDRKWKLRVYLGCVAGKHRYSSRTFEGTNSQARQQLTQMLRELDTETFVPPTKMLVIDYLNAWIKGKGDIGPKTRLDYEDRLQKDVIPFIGQMRLNQVSKLTVRGLYASLPEKRDIAPSTIRHTHRVLSQAFSQAVEDGLLARNPCEGAQKTIPRAQKTEAKFLSPANTIRLLEANEREPLYALWVLLVNTGMRPQEALALKWEDLQGDTLAVQRALVQIDRNGTWEARNEMKSDASRRNLQLDPSVLEALRAHKLRQNEAILAKGSAYRREGWIFSNEVGGFLDISKARRLWHAAVRRTGLPKIKLYEGTRHTHASHMLGGGIDVKTAAARLGHSSPVMLLSTYAHVLPQAASAAAGILHSLTREKA
jgi:integrase